MQIPTQVSTAPGQLSQGHTGFEKVTVAYPRMMRRGRRLEERPKKDTEAAQRHRGRRLIAL